MMKKTLFVLLLLCGSLSAQTTNSNIIPANTGQDLGSNAQRWDVFAQDVDISRSLRCRGKNICGQPGQGDTTGPHALLSTTHTDTLPASVVRGDIIIGAGSIPQWSRLAKGMARQCLTIDATATDIVWGDCGASAPVDVGITNRGSIQTATVLADHPFPFAVEIPQGCTHSYMTSGSAVDWTASINKNGSSIGSISCSGGSCNVSCSQTSFAEADLLTVVVDSSSSSSTPVLIGGSIYGIRGPLLSGTGPALATVAFSGSYIDLTNKPSFAAIALSGLWSDILSKPAFATISTTGSWNDLIDKPSLATVATSGAYGDLSGTPTLGAAAAKGISGNGANVASVTGLKTAGKQLEYDASGNVIVSTYDVGASLPTTGSGDHTVSASGVPVDGCGQFSGGNLTSTGTACGAGGGGGGSGTVASGTTGQFGYYSGAGTTISGRTIIAADIPNLAESQISSLVSDLASKVPTSLTVAGHALTGNVTISKSDVGLANVDNTSDINKPVSTAAQAALDLKAPLASPTFTGTVSGITKSMVGLGNADNTSDLAKPISTATQTALNAKATDAAIVHLAGNETITGSKTFSSNVLGNASTASALAANGTNCTTRQVPLGIDASGNAEGCYDISTVAVSGLYNDLGSKPTLGTAAAHAATDFESALAYTPFDAANFTVSNVVSLWTTCTGYLKSDHTCDAGASGTVSSFSAGALSPLFTTSVATSTSTPALSFSLSTAAAHKFFGNNTGSTAAPGFQTIGTGDLPFTYTGSTTKLATSTGSLTSGNCTAIDASGNFIDAGVTCGGGGGGGSVTSVGLLLPAADFTISNSPVVGAGTLTGAWASQSQNLVLASPNGSSGTPGFRALVAADVPTLNQNTTGSAAKWTTARNLAGNSADGSANVAFANKFIVQGTADSGLSGPQFLGALATGIVKNTTTTGVLSIAVAGDFPTLNQSTTGNAATVTNGVYTNASNTYSTGAQDFSSATSLKIPVASAPTPTGNGVIAYASTGNLYKVGVSGFTKTLATTDANVATATALAANGTNCSTNQYAQGVDASGNAEGCAQPGFSGISGTATTAQLPAAALIKPCQGSTGNGFNPITAGSYFFDLCWNDYGATETIIAISCYSDNAGTSTLNITNNAGTALLTGAITCGPNSGAGVAGTLSATTTLSSGDHLKVTITSDGASKQVAFRFKATL